MYIVSHTLVCDLTHNCASADDYFKTMKDALTLASSKMSVSDLAELELQVRLRFFVKTNAVKTFATCLMAGFYISLVRLRVNQLVRSLTVTNLVNHQRLHLNPVL